MLHGECKRLFSKEQERLSSWFRKFHRKERAKKTARNISKNTTLIIPAHNIPAFKPAKVFMGKDMDFSTF